MPASSSAATALEVGRYFENYGQIWNNYFPGCARRAHRDVISMLRCEEESVPFAAIRNRLADLFGLDPAAAESRLRDLQAAKLVAIASSSPRLHAQDLIEPTAKLYQTFDLHVVEACNRLLRTAQQLGHIDRFDAIGGHSTDLNAVFGKFVAGFAELWGEQLSAHLRRSFPKERAFRTKIERSLRTFAYWHILLQSWMSRNPHNPQLAPFLFVDDFHTTIYPVLHVKWPTTKEYVQDLIDWRLLERRTAAHGVPKNLFAIEIAPEVYDLIEGIFCEAALLFAEAARALQQDTAKADSLPHTTIVPFSMPAR